MGKINNLKDSAVLNPDPSIYSNKEAGSMTRFKFCLVRQNGSFFCKVEKRVI